MSKTIDSSSRNPCSIDIAYAAGLFDGEGSITIGRRKTKGARKPTYFVEILMGNTSLSVLEWMKQKFGGRITHNGGNRHNENHRQAWRWMASTRQAGRVLRLLLPFLKIKEKQAKLAISFQERVSKYNARNGNPLTEDELTWREQQKQLLSKMNRSCSSR